MKRYPFLFLALLSFALPSYAADFVIEDGEVQTSPQTLTNKGDKGLIERKGTLSTSGTAVTMQNDDQKLKNKGLIEASGTSNLFGILSEESNAKIKNSGTITASGGSHIGCIESDGSDARIKNSGTITASGTSGVYGIGSFGSNAKIKNSGTITASGTDGACGILSDESDAKIKNSGTITASGTDNILGIYSEGSNAKIKNSGTITASGTSDVCGILSEESNAKIKNSGTITASGTSDVYGIYSFGSNAKIKNSGTITASRTDSILGIYSRGDNLFLINLGKIQGSTSAIHSSGSNPTFLLRKGSRLVGEVDVENALNLEVKKGLNLDLTLTDISAGFKTLDIQDPFVRVDNRVAVVERAGLTMQTDFLADLSDSILGELHHRTTPCCKSACGGRFWGAAIGSYRNRDSGDKHSSYRYKQAGALVGYDFNLCEGCAGVFGSALFGRADVSANAQHAGVKSYVGGLTYSRNLCGSLFGVAVGAGYVDWENRRHVMNNLVPDGKETAKANLDGAFLTIEGSAEKRFSYNQQNFRTELFLRYAELYFGSYKEHGVEAPLSVEHRNIDLLTARLELGLEDFYWERGRLSLTPYVGVSGRFQLTGNKIDAELMSEDLNFSQGGKRNIVAGLIGVTAEKNLGSRPFYFNLEGSIDSGKSQRIAGGASFCF